MNPDNPATGILPHLYMPNGHKKCSDCGHGRQTAWHQPHPMHEYVTIGDGLCVACGFGETEVGWHGKKNSDDEPAPFWEASITGDMLETKVFDPLEYVIKPFIPKGGLTLLAAPPKTFKSLFALSCAIAVACGGKALSAVDAQPGAVLYISMDDQSQARAQRRIRSLLQPGEPIPAAFVLHTEPNIGVAKQAARNLDRYLNTHPECHLIVVDTLEYLRGDRDNGDSAYRHDVKSMAKLRWLLDKHPSVAILALLHTRKGEDEDSITSVGGTHGMTGAADCVLVLSGKRGSPRRLLQVVSRDEEESRHILQVTKGGIVLSAEDPDDPSVLLSTDDQKLYRTIRDDFPEGAAAVDLADVHPSIPNIGNRLARLSREGLLIKRARGVYVVY